MPAILCRVDASFLLQNATDFLEEASTTCTAPLRPCCFAPATCLSLLLVGPGGTPEAQVGRSSP